MKKVLIELDDATAKELERVAPARSRKRSKFIRSAIRRALWELEEQATAEAYKRQPDSSDTYVDPEVWEREGAVPTVADADFVIVRQYEIRWANMPAPVGRRVPVLLLSRTGAVRYLNKLIVAEVTSTVRDIPQEIPVGEDEGLSEPSAVNFDNVHVVAKRLLGERLGALNPSRSREVKRALGYALDWAELKVL